MALFKGGNGTTSLPLMSHLSLECRFLKYVEEFLFCFFTSSLDLQVRCVNALPCLTTHENAWCLCLDIDEEAVSQTTPITEPNALLQDLLKTNRDNDPNYSVSGASITANGTLLRVSEREWEREWAWVRKKSICVLACAHEYMLLYNICTMLYVCVCVCMIVRSVCMYCVHVWARPCGYI